jgi:hypothetical protein
MKKKIIFLITLLTLGVVACQKEKLPLNKGQTLPVASNNVYTPQQKFAPDACTFWKIKSFICGNEDLTAKFKAFTFELYADNSARATDGYYTVQGKWWIEPWTNQYYFYFDGNGIVPYDWNGARMSSYFNNLNGYWNILKQYPTGMVLCMTSYSDYKQLYLENL